MKFNKKYTLLFIAAFAFAVFIAVADSFSEDTGFGGLGFGVAVWLIIVVFPIAVTLTLLYGAIGIGSKLLSSKVSAEEKQGVMKRFLVVAGLVAVVYAAVYVF